MEHVMKIQRSENFWSLSLSVHKTTLMWQANQTTTGGDGTAAGACNPSTHLSFLVLLGFLE